MTKAHSEPHPPEFRDIVVRSMDFERAFEALEGYRHFHTETLRGFIRGLQNDVSRSWHHLDRAEKLSTGEPLTGETTSYLFLLRLYATNTAILEEALVGAEGATERTNEAMARFSDLEEPHSFLHDRTRITQISYYNLLRGDFQIALKTFEFLLEKVKDRFDDQQVGLFCGAAAAAGELGYDEVAQRHYESASLGLGMITLPFRIAVYSARLYTLLRHWNRDREAEAWLAKIEALDCPEVSRRHFLDRARFLTSASRARDSIFIA